MRLPCHGGSPMGGRRQRYVALGAGLVGAALLGAACDDASAPKLIPSTILVADGDGQSGVVESQLTRPVVFEVLDAAHRPVPDVVVAAHTTGDGYMILERAVTDRDGRVAVRWTLGSSPGSQRLELAAEGLSVSASATAVPCDAPTCEPPPAGPMPLMPIRFTTYDGSGQVVHPDAVWGPAGRGFWLTLTPYPYGNASYENPSFFRSRGGAVWQVPDGVVNPIAAPASGYFSDPDLVRDPASGELRIYFRQVAGGDNAVLLTRSGHDIDWTPPVEVARAASHQLISPAIVAGAPGAAWQMWSVNAGAAGCAAAATVIERRRSPDGIIWGPPEPVHLEHPGGVIWHLDVQWIPERQEYWALYTVYGSGGTCVTPQLHLATSSDGVTWTSYDTPVLARGALPAFRDVVYRSTLLYDAAAGLVRFWYSGATYEAEAGRYVWAAAAETRPADGLIESLGLVADARSLEPEHDLPPPEPDDMPWDTP